MGYSRALEFVVGGAAISGQQAVASGLANLSVPPDMLDAAVVEMVATVLRTPREVATVAKAVLIESAADRRRTARELVYGIALAERNRSERKTRQGSCAAAAARWQRWDGNRQRRRNRRTGGRR